MQMRKRLAIFMMIMLCICFAVNGTIQAQTLDIRPDHIGERFHTQDGVIYWIGDVEAVAVDFQKGAEAITMHSTVEGLPVHCDQITWAGGLASTIVVEAGVQGLSYIEIKAFPALETIDVFADVQFDWLGYMERHALLIDCPRLTRFQIHNNIGDENLVAEVQDCPLVIATALPPKAEIVKPRYIDTIEGSYRFSEETHGNEAICIVPEGTTHADIASSFVRCIELPSTLTWLSLDAPNLEEITLSDQNETYALWDGALYSQGYETLLAYPAARQQTHLIIHPDARWVTIQSDMLTSLTLPNDIWQILQNGTVDCPNLQEVFIPETFQNPIRKDNEIGGREIRDMYTSLADKAGAWLHAGIRFSVQPNHSTASVVDGLVYTADGKELVFVPPTHVKGELVIPEGTERIADFAMQQCVDIQSIVLPSTIAEFPSARAFFGLPNLASFMAAEGAQMMTKDGVLFSGNGDTLIARPSAHGRAYAVPNGTKTIAPYAFLMNDTLQAVSMPSSVHTIGECAFFSNYALEQIELPPGLESIGDYAFENCIKLKQLVLPKMLEPLGPIVGFDEYYELTMDALEREAIVDRLVAWVPRTVLVSDSFRYSTGGKGRLPRELLLIVEEDSAAHEYAVEESIPFAFAEDAAWRIEGAWHAILMDDADFVRAYSAPDLASDAKPYQEGSAMMLLGRVDGFCVGQMQINGEIVYVPEAQCRVVQEAWDDYGYASARKMSAVYATPQLQADVKWQLQAGDEVSIQAVFGPWCRVHAYGVGTGYMLLRDLECDDAFDDQRMTVHTQRVSQTLSLYAEPNIASNPIGHLYSGTSVPIWWATEDGWILCNQGYFRAEKAMGDHR